jgi:hypothetical protein
VDVTIQEAERFAVALANQGFKVLGVGHSGSGYAVFLTDGRYCDATFPLRLLAPAGQSPREMRGSARRAVAAVRAAKQKNTAKAALQE